jgi:drug/metabolite transporter (DMT)-like permease
MDTTHQPAMAAVHGYGNGSKQGTDSRRAIGPIGTAARLVAGLLLLGNVAYGQLVTQHVRPATWALGLLGFPALVLAWHVWRIRRHPAHFSYASPLSFALGALLFLALYFTWWYAPALSVTSDATLIFFGGTMVLTALRGYAGCEILTPSNWLLRRNDQIACAVFAPFDALDQRLARR